MSEFELPLALSDRIQEPDLIILIDYERNALGKYSCRYRLKSNTPRISLNYRSFQSSELNDEPEVFLRETFSFLSDAPTRRNLSENYFQSRLKRIGSDLYDRLFPDDLKHVYWNVLHHKIKSIQIVSNESWIPWELIRPYKRQSKEGVFLCEHFNIARWLDGPLSPDVICLNPLGIIKVESRLQAAQPEAEEIKRLFEKQGMEVEEVTPTFEEVNNRLASRGLFGLHFICHGSQNDEIPDYAVIRLANGEELSPIDINDDNLEFGQDCSIVFLNACETGVGGKALTGIGGWAEAFIRRAEIRAFIGTLWKSRDRSAYKFSAFFYQKLLEGKTIGEAAKLARAHIMQVKDPTWLTYSIYANPMARLLCGYCHQKGFCLKEPT